MKLKMKTMVTVWILTTLAFWTLMTNTYAADTTNSLNLDWLIWSLSNSGSTWTTTTTTTTPVKVTQKKLAVTKVNSNDYNIKNWNADYLLEFEVTQDTKIKDGFIKIVNKDNNKPVNSLYEDDIRTYKNGDTLVKWKKYYIELSSDYSDLEAIKQDNTKFDRIIKKTNWTIDSLNAEVVYTFKNTVVTPTQNQKVSTTVIKSKKTWFYDNYLYLAIMLMFISVLALRKEKA